LKQTLAAPVAKHLCFGSRWKRASGAADRRPCYCGGHSYRDRDRITSYRDTYSDADTYASGDHQEAAKGVAASFEIPRRGWNRHGVAFRIDYK
jgi:hypothetical protein